MKNLIVALFLVFILVFVSEVFSQAKQKKVDVYFCKHDGKNIIIDENASFLDSNYDWNAREKSIESLVKEYIGKNRDNDYFFNEQKKWMKDFTGISI